MKKHIFWLLIISYILKGCANQSSPTGGKKDVIPPKILINVPQNLSKNYNGRIVEIAFDEYVRVENLKQELLITPSPEGDYQYKLTKTGVRLTFEKPFSENTTYTLNFRNTFKDITEKNIAKNVKIVFSTGPVIDSLSIVGSVKDPLKNVGVFDIFISLYKAGDTTTVQKDKPYYSTRTDSAGKFTLENLKEGSYRIYAVEDRNANLHYDGTERIGFTDQEITLNQNVKDIFLSLVKIDKKPPKVDDTDGTDKEYTISFNEGIDSLEVSLPDNYRDMPYMRRKDRQVVFFNNKSLQDSIPVIVTAVDSSGNALIDTVKIKFDTQAKQEKVKKDWSVTTSPKNGEGVEKIFNYKIEFIKPIRDVRIDSIRVLADTIKSQTIPAENFTWNQYKTELTIKIATEAKRETRIYAPIATFISIENDTNKVIKTDHPFKEVDNYGIIRGKVNTEAPNFIIELLSADYKVIQRLYNQKVYEFNFLTDGDYRIRVIQDDNQNGKWDPGDLDKKILPEKISYLPAALKLKQNWELTDQDLTL